MSFIQFESANEKEKIREELRNVREELLKRAKKNAEDRAERHANEKLRGDIDWIHPSISKKLNGLDDVSKSKTKLGKIKKSKEKHRKKRKKDKFKKKKTCRSPRSDVVSSSDEQVIKKKRKKRKYSTEESSSSNSSSESEQEEKWVEKEKICKPLTRDDWMTSGLLLKTYSKEKDNKNDKGMQSIDSYDPGKSSRELNPHWRDGGSGLPTFQKPKDDEDCSKKNQQKSCDKAHGNWRKKEFQGKHLHQEHQLKTNSFSSSCKSRSHSCSRSKSSSSSDLDTEKEKLFSETKVVPSFNFLTDQQMNELGAKLVKAEIMGNSELVAELKQKLANARITREKLKEQKKQDFLESKSDSRQTLEKDDHILLTTTDSSGMTRPLLNRSTQGPSNPYCKSSSNRKKKSSKVETHAGGERVRFFPDDDRYNIKQMFEREKYTTAADTDAQFAEIAGKHKNPNDDLEDIFADRVRKGISETEKTDKEKNRAIYEHNKLTKTLDNCDKCFNSLKMDKQLLVSMGDYAYLSIPWYEGLQSGHCLIVSMQHASCAIQLDENVWEEINNYRKGLTRMFADKNQDVIFFETANYLHKRPHMVIHCVPGKFEMAPFYFKKAIQESEYEWSTNKQLVTLKEKNLRQSIPKGLPYFWVNFGMDSGFAHVIEDQERFPLNFAQEIIGGMLHMDPKKWRKPRKEYNTIPKVKQLADWWKPYDFTMLG